MGRRNSQVGAVLLALLGACSKPAPPEVSAIAGCYAVKMGSWISDPRNPGQRTPPPDTVALGTRPIVRDTIMLGYSVFPHAFDSLAQGAGSYWKWEGDSVIVIWFVAFASVQLRLAPSDSGLIGSVVSRTDLVVADEHGPIPWPAASVQLRRSSRCPAGGLTRA